MQIAIAYCRTMQSGNLAPTRKIRVVHYCNQLSLGGTERTMEIFCKYLDRSRFEVFAVSRMHRESLSKRAKVTLGAAIGVRAARAKKRLWSQMNARIPNFKAILGADHVLLAKNNEELHDLLLELSPDVLHVHYSGRAEPPTSDETVMSKIPVILTTNQFELENTAPSHRFVKRMFFVSRWLLENKAKWAVHDPRAEIFYNPVELPASTESLRGELGIPDGAFVIGRVGRADAGIHDPISLKAYAEIHDGSTWFLALSPPENMLREARSMNLKNFVALAPTADDARLSRFYNSIDVLAHARRDGETFGCNLAEAMIHGKPVVSHLTPFMNAQLETVGEGGYVVGQQDWQAYARHLKHLKQDAAFRAELSQKAKRRALDQFEARRLTDRLARTYLALAR